MKTTFFIYLFLLLIGNSAFGAEFPSQILKMNYGGQFKYTDSLYNIIANKEFPTAIAELNALEKEANHQKATILSKLFHYFQLRLTLDKNKMNSDYENTLIEFIHDAGDEDQIYIRTETLQLLARYYWEKKNFSFAIENYLYAHQNYTFFSIDEFPNKTEYQFELGGKYYYLRDFQTAKIYFQEIWNTINKDKISGKISKMNSLALCYRNLEEYDSSFIYFHKALEFAEEENAEIWIGIISGNLGNIYYMQNNFDKAIPLIEKNIELSKKHQVYQDLAISQSELGSMMLSKNEPQKAMDLQIQAMEIIKLKNLYNAFPVVSRIYPNLAKAYAALGNYEMAYKYLDSANFAKDSVKKYRNIMFISGVQHKMDVEKHMKDIQSKEADLKHQKLLKNALFIGLAMLLLLLFFVVKNLSNQKKSNSIISAEKQKSDMLLLNILPAEVAEELKETGNSKARQFDNVTVLFTDFVGFTSISEHLSAQELVEELHSCFTAFDEIIERNGLEKIKTIGDAYMAICGLPTADENHAKKAVLAGLEIAEYIEQNKAKGGKFSARIGVNSGTVVAGIVGVKKFAYDIWGDTVNIANRMESSGEVGKVNISETTYDLVKDDFKCTYRGKIEAKNKGELDMYFAERIS